MTNLSSSGLTEKDLRVIRQVLTQHPEVESAILFGSRAKNTHRPGSDVDIALQGKHLEKIKTLISGQLNEETPLPYFFDILDYSQIDNSDLIEHIDRVGVKLYP